MGDLAMKYGFYSADWDVSASGLDAVLGEGGEALTVTDPDEAWVFHISPDPSGAKAVWVAQRVPDDHIAVVANAFVIKEVDPKNKKDFLYSDNLWAVAEEMGWWTPESKKLLHFTKTYAPESYRPDYSNRRVWRVLSLAAPSANLSAFTDPLGMSYPFSVKVDSKLSAEDLMQFQRDHFEGTEFSLTEGLAAGPYGNPNRFDAGPVGDMTAADTFEGEFPRAISLFRLL